MNLKAKNEWRRSGERAGASTGPARATGLATHLLLLSSSCHPVATLLRPPFSSENPHTPAQVWALLRSVYSGRRSLGHLSLPQLLPLSSV